MKTKRLHAIVKYFYPVAAGIETNMLETYRHFVDQGWEIVVHTSADTLTEKNVLQTQESIKGIAVRRYPYRWYGFFPEIPWNDINVVAFHNFNVVPHGLLLAYIAVRKLCRMTVPIVMLTPHGGFTPDWQIFSKPVALLKKIYHYTLGTVLINTAVTVVRAVSTWEQQEIARHGVRQDKIITITNGLEDEAFMDIEKKASNAIKERVKTYGKYLIQIGRIYNIKNYETVIKSLPKLPSDLNFVIVGPVGDQNYKQSLENLIQALGLTDRVFFAGVIRGVDKYYLIKHAQCMVHMARWESFCNAVHEGMSQGKVVIVSDSYALPYLVKDGSNGYVLPYDNIQLLTDKLLAILSDHERMKEISETNKKFTREHSWKSVSQSVLHNLV